MRERERERGERQREREERERRDGAHYAHYRPSLVRSQAFEGREERPANEAKDTLCN